jgi:hypothetical protein
MLADTSPVRSRTTAAAAIPAPGEQARAAAAQAVMAPRAANAARPAVGSQPLPTPCGPGAGSVWSADRSGVADGASGTCWLSPADIGPPCLDYPDIRYERYLNRYIVIRALGALHDIWYIDGLAFALDFRVRRSDRWPTRALVRLGVGR